MICREGCQINAAPAAHKSLRKCPTRWQNVKEIENLPPELIFLPGFKSDMKVDWSQECTWLWGLIGNASNVDLCVFIPVGKVCYSFALMCLKILLLMHLILATNSVLKCQ